MKVLVMGGTRMLGRCTVDELLSRGHDVTVFNRGLTPATLPEHVHSLRGDRDVPEDLDQLRRLEPEAVIDFSGYTARHTKLLLDRLPDVPRYVHCSSGAVYQASPVLPWSELRTPLGPWTLWGQYAADKLAAERVLQEARYDESTATTLLRPPYVLCPGNYAVREEWVLNRLLDDQEVLVPGDGLNVLHFVSARQVAAAAATALDTFSRGGCRAFNIAEPSAVTSALGFVDLCAEAVGKHAGARLVRIPPGDFDRDDAVFPFPPENYLLDTRAAQAAGIQPPETSLREMIAAALEHLLDHPERRRWTRSEAELRWLDAA